MPYLTQLADVARRTGYPVTEVPGWRTRGHGPQPEVQGIVCHHTAGWNDLHIVRDGRPGLDGPLSQIWLRRDGTIYVVAAGRCWHNAPSTSPYHDNSSSLGIEAENDGRRAWPAMQLDAYKRLCAELCREFGLSASRVKGHKEVNTAKVDPHSISMTTFRAEVARLIEGDDMTPDQVWHDARIAMSKGSTSERRISPAAYLQELETEQDRIKSRLDGIAGTLDAQAAAIRELTAAHAAHHQEVDADALIARIEAAIETVTVRLTVGDSDEP